MRLRLVVACVMVAGFPGGAAADDCADVRRVLALAREARMEDQTLVALERRHCPVVGAAVAAQSACEDLTVMSVLGRMVELDVEEVRAVDGARAVHCGAQHAHESRFDRWAPGVRARGSSGEWYYPNGRLARASDGRWYYANGRAALRWGGTWYYPNGVTAHRPEGEWRFADGVRARGLVELSATSCTRVGHPLCFEAPGDRVDRVRDVEIMALAWAANLAAEVERAARR